MPVIQPSLPPPPTPTYFKSGNYVSLAPSNSLTATTLTYGALRLTPLHIFETVTFTRVGAEVTIAGDAASTAIIAIYSDGGTLNHSPNGLLFDSSATGSASTILNNGLIGGASATVQEITVAWTLTPGLYWAGGVCQGTGTQPTFRVVNVTGYQMATGTTIPAAGLQGSAFVQTAVTSTLPSTFTAATTSQAGPRLFAKVA